MTRKVLSVLSSRPEPLIDTVLVSAFMLIAAIFGFVVWSVTP